MVIVQEENPTSTNPVKNEVDDGYNYNLQKFGAATAVNKSPIDFHSKTMSFGFPFSKTSLLKDNLQNESTLKQTPSVDLNTSGTVSKPEVKEEVEDKDTPPSLAPVPVKKELQSDFLYVPANEEDSTQALNVESSPTIDKQDRWFGEFVPSRRHPLLIFKFMDTDSETGENVWKCYTFTSRAINKNSISYACSYCVKLKNWAYISAVGDEFQKDPMRLNHKCTAKIYDLEINYRKRFARAYKHITLIKTGSENLTSTEGTTSRDTATQPPANSEIKEISNLTIEIPYTSTTFRRLKYPAIYFRENVDDDKCWLFVGSTKKRNGTFECNGCYFKGIKTKIWVEDGKFCGSPSLLAHVCVPLSWTIEEKKKKHKLTCNREAGIFQYSDVTDEPVNPLPEKFYDAVTVRLPNHRILSMFYRSNCDKDLCWLFMSYHEYKNGYSAYCCAVCSWENQIINKIMVKDWKFCTDPSALSHVCQPLSWPEQKAKIDGEEYVSCELLEGPIWKRISEERKENSGVEETGNEEPKQAEDCIPEKRIKVENEC